MLLLLVLTGAAQAQHQERRIALVVGNGAYQTGALPTSANDAGLIAQTLQAAGFEVVGARDLDAATLRSSFREFLDKAGSSGADTVAVVYFAGYGVQFEGENYLVPVDARLAHDSDVPLEAVRLSDLTKPLAGIPLKARIVILDAARANSFGEARQPLAGGLALMQPDPGLLIALNAAPGTIAPESSSAYGAYATALSEMIKEGGLPLDQLFERVRLRVSELSNGAELAWYASRIEQPFLFFERTAAAPKEQDGRFSELTSRPVREFDPHEAYLAALARDTMSGYEDFLAVYPHDPLAKRVRTIIAARREAMTWHESALTDSPEAYWSYLQRYPRGPHAYEARRRLAYFDASLEPPASFELMGYDIPPPPPEEIIYVERPVVYFWDPEFDLAPPPPVPVFFLAPQPTYYADYPPPPAPIAEFALPVPDYYPVAIGVDRPVYVVPPPVNIINVNVHNKVVINEADQTAVVTDPAGRQVPPLPPNLLTPQQSSNQQLAPGNAQPNIVQAHPAATAAIAAAVAVLPAAALRAKQAKTPPTAPVNKNAVLPSSPASPGQLPGQLPKQGLASPNSRQPQPGVRTQLPAVPKVLPPQAPLPATPKAPTTAPGVRTQPPAAAKVLPAPQAPLPATPNAPATAPGVRTQPPAAAKALPAPQAPLPATPKSAATAPGARTKPPAAPKVLPAPQAPLPATPAPATAQQRLHLQKPPPMKQALPTPPAGTTRPAPARQVPPPAVSTGGLRPPPVQKAPSQPAPPPVKPAVPQQAMPPVQRNVKPAMPQPPQPPQPKPQKKRPDCGNAGQPACK
jgi:uncharacterized caspase-like protein